MASQPTVHAWGGWSDRAVTDVAGLEVGAWFGRKSDVLEWHAWGGWVVGEDRRLRPYGVVEPARGEEAERKGVTGGSDALLQVEAALAKRASTRRAEASCSESSSSVAMVDGNVDDVDVQGPVAAATWDDGPAELRLHRAAAEVEVSAPCREAVEEELAQCSPLRQLELAQRRPPVERVVVVVVVVHERQGGERTHRRRLRWEGVCTARWPARVALGARRSRPGAGLLFGAEGIFPPQFHYSLERSSHSFLLARAKACVRRPSANPSPR